MIRFDTTTRTKWQEQNIHFIIIRTKDGGCEGKKVLVEPVIEKPHGYTEIAIESSNCRAFVLPEEISLFEDAHITNTGDKWILKSSHILGRCGCGSSFSLKTGNPKLDKIQLLKSKLATKKGHHH